MALRRGSGREIEIGAWWRLAHGEEADYCGQGCGMTDREEGRGQLSRMGWVPRVKLAAALVTSVASASPLLLHINSSLSA